MIFDAGIGSAKEKVQDDVRRRGEMHFVYWQHAREAAITWGDGKQAAGPPAVCL